MDASNLSSNWKRLQATLAKSTSKDAVKKTPNNGAASSSLKRKADHDVPAHTKATGSSKDGVKRFRKIASSTYTAPSRTRPHKMGAYFSSQASSAAPTETALPPTDDSPAQPNPNAIAGKYIAIDCEMVGTHSMTSFAIRQRSHATTSTATAPPEYSILARVSLVSYASEVLYDAYVLPPPGVTVCDYRTPYSGITAWHLSPSNPTTNPVPFEDAQHAVAALLQGRILVGHALNNDLAILGLSHPKRSIRDTARYPPFRTATAVPGGKSRAPSLKKLAHEVLGWEIQGDVKKGHSSVEDASAAMALFRREKDGFEREAAKLYGRPGQVKGPSGRQVREVLDENGDEGGGELDEEEAERRRPSKKKKGRKK